MGLEDIFTCLEGASIEQCLTLDETVLASMAREELRPGQQFFECLDQ